MFLKTNSPSVAKDLAALGFSYTVEQLGEDTFYCFIQTEELAKTILGQYADEPFMTDDVLRF